MRKQIEILIYQYKKQNNLDVYSALPREEQEDLLYDIDRIIDRIEFEKRVSEQEKGYYNV